MNRHAKRVMDALLGKYERSNLAKGVAPKRAIQLVFTFTETTMPAYFAEDSYVHRGDIEAAMETLATQGFVWIKRDRYGDAIERIILNLDAIETIYASLGRISPSRRQVWLLEILDGFASHSENVKKIIIALKDKVNAYEAVKTWFNPDDPEELKDLLVGLEALDTNKDAISKRRFSVQVYHDSKRFETLQTKLFHCEHLLGEEVPSTLDAWLEAHGIVSTPTYLHLKGRVHLSINGIDFDVSKLGEELVLSSDQLPQVILKTLDPPRVTTIENYTTFHDHGSMPGMSLYLAGFHNRAKTTFLQSISHQHPSALFYHFGDLDVGGFRIFVNLRAKTGIDVQPLHMDLATFNRHLYAAKPLEGQDRKHLEAMRQDASYRPFHALIERMLETGKKLEQEAVDF